MRDPPDIPQEWASSTLTSSAALTTCTQVWLHLRLPRVSDTRVNAWCCKSKTGVLSCADSLFSVTRVCSSVREAECRHNGSCAQCSLLRHLQSLWQYSIRSAVWSLP